MAEQNELVGDLIPYSYSNFSHFWKMESGTERIYAGVSLASLSGKARVDAIEGIVRSFVELGHAVYDAPGSKCVNGSNRGANSTTCDFLAKAEDEEVKRVEVKSCMMVWDKSQSCFKLHFAAVKQHLYDVLYLAWMTPRGIHIFQHDGKARVSTHCKDTEARGKQIQFRAPGGTNGYHVPRAAEVFLLKTLKWHGLPYLGFIEFAQGDCERVMARAVTGGSSSEEAVQAQA